MSASICWRPKKEGLALLTSAPSSFQEHFTMAFGHAIPCELTEDNLVLLLVLGNTKHSHQESYAQLAAAVEKHGEITLDIEY